MRVRPGMGVSEEDFMETFEGNVDNLAEFTTIKKDDLEFIGMTLDFSQNYLIKQSEFIQLLSGIVKSLEPANKTEYWDTILKEVDKQAKELDDYAAAGVRAMYQGMEANNGS